MIYGIQWNTANSNCKWVQADDSKYLIMNNNIIYSINPSLYKDGLIPDKIQELHVVKENNEGLPLNEILTKQEINDYGYFLFNLSEQLLSQFDDLKIIKWSKKSKKINMKGEYKYPMFKCIDNCNILLNVEDVTDVILDTSIETYNLLNELDKYSLYAYNDAEDINNINIDYNCESYKVIDKLDDNFNILSL